ncbi:MAG: AsmA family protein [Candidatus Omnitrophota bacterium]
MKKWWMVLIAVVILACGAVGYFIFTFDSGQARALIVAKLTEATGYPVRLDSVSLGWAGGLGIRLKGFSVYAKENAPDPAVRVEEASATLDLLPLLRQRVKIGAIRLESPEVRIIRGRDGLFRLMGISPGEVPAAVSGSGNGNGLAALSVLIDDMKIRGGKVLYVDESFRPSLEVRLQSADVDLTDISMTSPLRVKASAALYGQEKNVSLRAQVTLPVVRPETQIRDLHLEADLGRIDWSALLRSLPELGAAGFPSDLKGIVTIDASRLELPLAVGKLPELALQIRDGRWQLPELAEALDNIRLKMKMTADSIDAEEASFSAAGGEVHFKADVRGIQKVPAAALEGRFTGISLERVIPPSPDSPARMTGAASGEWQIRGQGTDALGWARSASGKGHVEIAGPVVKNLNILRDVFNRIDMIPGLVNRLLTNLPPSYQDQLKEPDTVLADIRQNFTVEGGVAVLPDIAIATRNFSVTGEAQVTAEGYVTARTMLAIEPDLSAALIRSVRELQYLTDQGGSIRIPLRWEGPPGKVAMMPDLQYLGAKLAVSKATEFLSGLFEPKAQSPQSSGTTASGESSTASNPNAPSSPTQASPESVILNTVLGSLFGSGSEQSKDTKSS